MHHAAEPCPLCIVMPAYNEEGCIESVVRGWLGVLDRPGLEGSKLVVVNDGSRDSTGAVLDRLAADDPRVQVYHRPNGGHGAALRFGYTRALEFSPEWVFQTDSDDQFETSDFFLVWDRRGASDYVLGRRLHRKDAFHRLVITRVLKLLNLILFGRYIPDVNVPFRLARGPYLRSLLDRVPEGVFAPNIFLSVLASEDGNELMNVPVTHRDRRTGKVSIVRIRLLKVCLRCVGELWRWRTSRAWAARRPA